MRSNLLAAASKAEAGLPLAWWRYSSIAIAALLVGALLWPLWWSAGEGAAGTGLAQACAQWDDLARDSIARRVQDGKRDADLRQLGDAIFRLRRARRNCDAGWTTLACQDYLAVARGIPESDLSRTSVRSGCVTANVEAAAAVQ